MLSTTRSGELRLVLEEYDEFKKNVSTWLAAKQIPESRFGSIVAEAFHDRTDNDTERDELNDRLRALSIGISANFSRIVKALRDEARAEIDPAFRLFFISKIDREYRHLEWKIETVLFNTPKRQKRRTYETEIGTPPKLRLWNPITKQYKKVDFRNSEYASGNSANSNEKKAGSPTIHQIHKVPFSPKYGLRYLVLNSPPNADVSIYFSPSSHENLLFQIGEDLDLLLLRLAEIVSATFSDSEQASKSFSDLKKSFFESRTAIENFLGLDRPMLSEFSAWSELENPERKRHSFQRLAAAGVNLTDLSKMGERLLQEVSRLHAKDMPKSFVIRIVTQAYERKQVDEFAIKLRNLLPPEMFRKFEFIVAIENSDSMSDMNVSHGAGTSCLNHLAILKFLESSVDCRLPSYETLKKRAIRFFEGSRTSGSPILCADFLKYLDAQRRNGFSKEERRYAAILSTSRDLSKRLSNFLVSGNFHSLDSLLIEYARIDSPAREFLDAALSSLYENHSPSDLAFLSRVRTRLDFFNGVGRNAIPIKVAAKFLEEFIEQASKVDEPSTSRALYLISYYRFREGNIEQAKKYCEESLRSDSKNYSARCFLGLLKFQDGNYDQALQSFQIARKDSGNEYEFAHFYEGIVHEEISDLSAAKISYVQALLLKPNFYEAAHNLCNCLVSGGRILDASRLAAAQITRFGALTPEFACVLAFGLVLSGHSKEARDLLLKTNEARRAPIVEYNIAVLYFNRAQAGRCQEWLDRLRTNSMCPKFILRNANNLEQRISRKELPSLNEGGLLEVSQDELIDPMLRVLFDKHFSGELFSQNQLVQFIQRTLQRVPRHPTEHMPRSLKRAHEAKLTYDELEKRKEQRRNYALALKKGRQSQELKVLGRKRRKESRIQISDHSQKVAAGLLLAPSYSGG